MNQSLLRYHLPPILWASLIFVASSIPSDELPTVELIGADKIAHIFVYFVLCWLTHRSLLSQKRWGWVSDRSLLVSAILTIAYGITDEIHQTVVPGRTASVGDVVANSIGVLAYLGVYRRIAQKVGKRRQKTV